MVYRQLSVLNRLPSKDTPIVDVGCGDGRILKPFYDAGYSVIGIDSNSIKINEAQSAMPQGKFRVENIEHCQILRDGFFIARNSLPFLKSKDNVINFINKIRDHSFYLTLFGEKDEKAIDRSALWWNRDEVDALIARIGNVIRFSETIGESTNLAGKTRQSHIFEIYR